MARTDPLVSVVIIFYNAATYLDEAVASVFGQTFQDWELLLADDGSTDASTALARRYAEEHPERVRYLEHPGHQNRGMSATRNLGVRHARGAYVALLDSDDLWLPHKLAQHVAALQAYPEASAVCAPAQHWYSWSGHPADQQRDYAPSFGLAANTLAQPPQLLTHFYPLGGHNSPCPSNITVRRAAIERLGGFEESFQGPYQLYEDQAFLAKLYLHEPVFVADEPTVRYRQHPDSCSSVAQRNGDYRRVRGFYLRWLTGYLDRQAVHDPAIRRALRRARWHDRHPIMSSAGAASTALVGRGRKVTGALAQRLLPRSLHRRLWDIWQARLRPRIGRVRWGQLRRLTPLSREFGYDRGQPIDRYYIEQFLQRYAADVRGRVLEIGDDSYTRRFGGARVTRRDVLHVAEGNPHATFVGDLATADQIPSDAFDCVILTQTLHLIYDLRAALQNVYRILKPGGVLLATVPGISQISSDQWSEYWYWSFTTRAVQRLFGEVFPPGGVMVEARGNVLAAAAFLYGAAAEELRQPELDERDRAYELLITVRAVKGEAQR